MQESIDGLGILFDEIMRTGTVQKFKSAKRLLHRDNKAVNVPDESRLESGQSPIAFGRGQVLFVVRQVPKAESSRLQASGFRFAKISNISDLLARSMEVDKNQLTKRLARIGNYVYQRGAPECGIHLALFAIRPLYHRGFDIVVQSQNKQMLPCTPLLLDKLEDWQMDLLKALDNQRIGSIREQLYHWTVSPNHGKRVFVSQLLDALDALGAQISNSFFEEARLTAQLFELPSHHNPQHPTRTTLIAFRLLIDAHERSTLGDRCELSPLRLFLSRQHISIDGRSDETFAQDLRQEFADYVDCGLSKEAGISVSRLLSRQSRTDLGRCPTKSAENTRRWPGRIWPFSRRNLSKDDASERGLVTVSPVKRSSGIHVSNEVDVTITEEGSPMRGQNIEMNATSCCSNSYAMSTHEGNFIDKLLTITLDDQRKHRDSRPC